MAPYASDGASLIAMTERVDRTGRLGQLSELASYRPWLFKLSRYPLIQLATCMRTVDSPATWPHSSSQPTMYLSSLACPPSPARGKPFTSSHACASFCASAQNGFREMMTGGQWVYYRHFAPLPAPIRVTRPPPTISARHCGEPRSDVGAGQGQEGTAAKAESAGHP